MDHQYFSLWYFVSTVLWQLLYECNLIYYRLAEKQTELNNAVDKSPPQKYLEAMEALMKWVHNVEGVLLSEHAVVTDAAVMEDQLQKFKVSNLVTPLTVDIYFI